MLPSAEISPVFISRYTLVSEKGPLNSKSGRTSFEGALLRAGGGFGCIHPWPELGDAPLEEQLQILQEGGTTPLVERAFDCCRIDGEARAGGRNLFDGLTVPGSHQTLVGEMEIDPDFDRVKVKMGTDFESEARRLERLAASVPGVLFRPDFNAVPDAEGFGRWMGMLSEDVRGRLDFVEDPFPYDPLRWAGCQARWGVSLALDRSLDRADGGFDVAVVKPAVSVLEVTSRTVVTSAMDHPVGQLFAAYEAARAAAVIPGLHEERHGLLTHGLFELDAFSEQLGVVGTRLVPPAGTGLGFDDLLDKLRWERLC